MAKSRTAASPRARVTPRERTELTRRERPAVNSRFYYDLAAVVMCALGVFLAITLFRPGVTGPIGRVLETTTRLFIGHVVFLAPVLLIAGGIIIAMDYRRATSSPAIIGVSGLLLMLFGWLHLMSWPNGGAYNSTTERFWMLLGRPVKLELAHRADGGLIGAIVTSLLSPFGVWGSYIVMLAVAAACGLLVSDMTIAAIAHRLRERSMQAREAAAVRAAELRAQREEKRLAKREELIARSNAFIDLDDEEEQEVEARETRRSARGRRRTAVEAEEPTNLPVPVITTIEPEPDPAPFPMESETIMVEPEPVEIDAPVAVTPSRRRIPKTAAPARKEEAKTALYADFKLPPTSLLDAPAPRQSRGKEADQNIAVLEKTLSTFKIDAQVVEIADGPTVTRYELRLGDGIRVRKILDLAENIAMSLAALSVRVEAPIPGKSAIGIEVPKKHATAVTLRECLETEDFRTKGSAVTFALGKDVSGEARYADLTRMPHLLVAGATNSGKSVCLNGLIASMLFRARPDEVKFIMIDPKRVELTLFSGIPHLIHPVIKDVKQAAGILRWVLKEMDRRYELFNRLPTRNIEGFNNKMQNPEDRLPFIVVVIDELADLMMQQGPEVEQLICRLAQLARATGIHLVIATQRPSVDVITGLIKANVPSRIAFSVMSQVDSRTILDQKGAESLIGKGDMLYKPIDALKPHRIQGAFLKEEEVERLVAYLKEQGTPDYIAEVVSVDSEAMGGKGQASMEEAEDDMFEPAVRFVVTTGHASTSLLQRKFKLGYTRAARLVDMMESRGILGPLDGAKPREILMGPASVDQMFRATRDSLFEGTELPEDEDEGPDEDPFATD